MIFFLFFSIVAAPPFIVPTDDTFSFRLLKIFWIGIVVPVAIFTFFYFYPSMEKKSLESKKELLPNVREIETPRAEWSIIYEDHKGPEISATALHNKDALCQELILDPRATVNHLVQAIFSEKEWPQRKALLRDAVENRKHAKIFILLGYTKSIQVLYKLRVQIRAKVFGVWNCWNWN